MTSFYDVLSHLGDDHDVGERIYTALDYVPKIRRFIQILHRDRSWTKKSHVSH